jgi:Xaa-Pro aminopeptidase
MAVHEAPGISWRSKDLIRKGMVFTIEPGIYLQGFGGVRIEDMVVAERYGPELLTSLSRRFTSV